jgi:hypothetical protein
MKDIISSGVLKVHSIQTPFDCTEFTEFFWTFSIVLYSKKHDVSETGSVSGLR